MECISPKVDSMVARIAIAPHPVHGVVDGVHLPESRLNGCSNCPRKSKLFASDSGVFQGPEVVADRTVSHQKIAFPLVAPTHQADWLVSAVAALRDRRRLAAFWARYVASHGFSATSIP